MGRDSIAPTAEERVSHGSTKETVYSHEAFGTIVITHPQGGSGQLFGSDVKHMGCVRITINKAELHRNLSRDWIHSSRSTLCEVDMTHAQFAQFITGVGRGEGTPVTLRVIREGAMKQLAEIASIETKHEIMSQEVEESAKERLSALQVKIAELGALIESGKLGKTALKAIHGELSRHVSQLPGSLRFVLDQAQETLETATSTAKIEVEAFIDAKARGLGLKSLSELVALGEDSRAAVALTSPVVDIPSSEG